MKYLIHIMLAITINTVAFGQQNQSSVPQGSTPKSPELIFSICDNEAFSALDMARNYILFKDSKEHIRILLGESQELQKIATELFEKADSGRIKHHADFAADKLIECAAREGMAFDKPRDQVKVCFARVDIPFLLISMRDKRMTKSEAVTKVSTMLKDRSVYPIPLIAMVADMVYSNASMEEDRKTMRGIFWNFIYN